MIEQKYSFRHPTLNLDQAYYYTLLLCVEPASFSVAISYDNKLLAYETNCSLDELTDPKQLQEILSATYKKTIVALSSSVFSLVPHAIFNAGHLTDFARLLDVKDNEKVLVQIIDPKNYVVYKIDDQQWSAVSQFDTKNLVFAPKGWIRAIAMHEPVNNKLYVNISNGSVEFLYFKNNDIRFYNTFVFKNATDVLYFSTLVTQELDIRPQDTTLVLSGNVNHNDNLFAHLTEFFSQVMLNEIQPLELPGQISPHQLLPLAALNLCAS